MLFATGNISNTVKLQIQDNKWMQNKKSEEQLSKKELNKRDEWTTTDWQIYNFKNQLDDNRQSGIISEIYNKIMAGEELTPEEEKYLEKNNPTALQEYRNTKLELKAYEEKLKGCKTKDEVKRLKVTTMAQELSAFKKVENNPCIPKSEKLAKAEEMLAKARNVQKAEERFMQTAHYGNMPEEGEIASEAIRKNNYENIKRLKEIKESVSDDNAVLKKGEEAFEKSDKALENELKDTDDIFKEIENTYGRIAVGEGDERTADLEKRTDKKSGNYINYRV